MGYLHIDNLYKNKTILLFKEVYALEKIHGTSSNINWDFENKIITFFSGGEDLDKFISLFDVEFLKSKFLQFFPDKNVTIFGEAYGGKQQGMSHTYGKILKFIAFDVKVDHSWLNVPNANEVCDNFKIDFVHWYKINTDLDSITAARDMFSVQAYRNGMGKDKKREGIILRPLIEMKTNNGERVIVKYKHDKFNETKTPRKINEEALKILEDANEIADEWVTPMRLQHVLQKFPNDVNVESMGDIVKAMTEDVYREGKNEIVESKQVIKAITRKTVSLFKMKLENDLKNQNTNKNETDF